MATDVIFTTNPADIGRVPALYVVERDPPGFVQGRDLSRVIFYGKTVKGPTDIQLVTNPARFLEIYGGRDFGNGGDIENEVWKGLLNKRFGAFYVKRVVAGGATPSVAASFNAEDGVDGTGTEIVKVEASSAGGWGASLLTRVEAATDGDASHWNLRVRSLGEEVLYENLDTTAGNDNLAIVIGDDPGNLVVVTKLADGTPSPYSTVTEAAFVAALDADGFLPMGTAAGAAYTGVDAVEGTLETTDYTSALTEAANFQGPAIVCCPESLEDTVGAGAQATLNGAMVTVAPTVVDRMFVTWSGKYGEAPSADVAAVAAQITTPSDRIVWCYNSTETVDPFTDLGVRQGAHTWMASILSQTDVDVHPGAAETAQFLAGVRRLANQSLTNDDLIVLGDAGISAMERLPDGFRFRDGKVTDQAPGRDQITRRRMTDFLQLSLADRLRFFVKAKSTIENRAQISGETEAFLQELQATERVVEEYEVDQDSVNTAAQRARGIERIFVRVNLIDHMLALVLETEIGTGVVIATDAA